MSQTRFSPARALPQRQAAIIVGLSIVFLTEFGCAATRPAIKRHHDPAATAAPLEKSAEPAVAANVALKTDQASGTDLEKPAMPASSRSKSALSRLGTRFHRIEPRSKETTPISDGDRSDDSDPGDLVEADRSDSSMERLNAALTDDVAQSNLLPQRSLTTLDERMRVDSLVSRAKQLLEIGQLEPARQAAQTAQELSEASQIDFFPDEDRPIDLIRRIEGKLKESRARDEPGSRNDSTELQVDEEVPINSKPVTKSSKTLNPPEKDSSGLARIRRDWSTLFRRERKPTGSEPTPASPETQLANVESVTKSRDVRLLAGHISNSDSSEAIVTANRGVSLASQDSGATRSSELTSEPADQTATEPDSVQLFDRASRHSQSVDAVDPTDLTSAIIFPRLPPRLATIDGVSVLPETDIVDAMTPFHPVKTMKEEAARTETVDDADTRQSDSIFLYLIFGICSLLAVGCYRRGAT